MEPIVDADHFVMILIMIMVGLCSSTLIISMTILMSVKLIGQAAIHVAAILAEQTTDEDSDRQS